MCARARGRYAASARKGRTYDDDLHAFRKAGMQASARKGRTYDDDLYTFCKAGMQGAASPLTGGLGAVPPTPPFPFCRPKGGTEYLFNAQLNVRELMLQFFLKRLLGLLFVLLGVSFITFIIGYFSPIDPVAQQLGQHYTPESYARLRHAYGLDLPWYLQYFRYVVNLLHFDLGRSIHNQSRRVIDLLRDGIPISAEIATWGLLITLMLGIPAGILSAIKANTWIDTTNMVLALILYALPVFIIAIFAQLLIVWLNVNWDLGWPVTNWGIPWQYSWSDIQYKLVPIMVYGMAGYAYYARLARTSMLEVLRQDYIRTAHAKGLLQRTIVYRHALRNALLPLITVLGLSIGLLITGAFFIERIFNIQGIGLTTINAVSQGDFPVIQATALLAALGVVLGNMISDILYTIVDPRIKLA